MDIKTVEDVKGLLRRGYCCDDEEVDICVSILVVAERERCAKVVDALCCPDCGKYQSIFAEEIRKTRTTES